MDRLVRIEKDQFCSGVFLDQTQQVAPLWTSAQNVMFSEGMLGVFPGSIQLFQRQKIGTICGISELSSIVTGAKGICFGFGDSLHLWDADNGIQDVGSGYTSIADQTETQLATRWSIQQWNEWVVSTNGQDPMQLLKVVGTGFANMTTDTSTQFKYAEIIRKYRQFLIAFDLTLADGTRQPNAAAWCDVNDVETWVPSADNSARKIFIPDLESRILCAESLGDHIFCYSDDSAYAVNYAGYPDVFDTQKLPKGVGVFGKNCVAEINGLHYGFGPRGVWRFDGATYEYIDTPPLKKYLNKVVNQAQGSKCVVYNDRTINHLMLFYPKVGGTGVIDEGQAFNYIENKWTPVTFRRTAAIDSGVFPYGISGDENGNVFQQSLLSVPASDGVSDVMPVSGAGRVIVGYGQGGYGERGYGGFIV